MSNQLKQDHYKVAAQQKEEDDQYLAGRGAQFNTKNKFLKNQKTKEHIEAIDDWEETNTTNTIPGTGSKNNCKQSRKP